MRGYKVKVVRNRVSHGQGSLHDDTLCIESFMLTVDTAKGLINHYIDGMLANALENSKNMDGEEATKEECRRTKEHVNLLDQHKDTGIVFVIMDAIVTFSPIEIHE